MPEEILRLRGIKRAYVESIPLESKTLLLDPKATHHLKTVLKARTDERVLLLDRTGKRALCRVEGAKEEKLMVEIQEILEPPKAQGPKVVVLQALLKGTSQDYAIERLSELGVDSLYIFISDHSIPRPAAERALKKRKHWEAISMRSYLQCDRKTPMEIQGPFALKELLETARGWEAPKILLCEREQRRSIGDVLNQFKTQGSPEQFTVAIGPEGGLHDQEIRAFHTAGFISVCLGPRIFKAESVGIVACSIIQYELGDIKGIDISG